MYDVVKESELDKKINGEVDIIFDDVYKTIWFMWKQEIYNNEKNIGFEFNIFDNNISWL